MRRSILTLGNKSPSTPPVRSDPGKMSAGIVAINSSHQLRHLESLFYNWKNWHQQCPYLLIGPINNDTASLCNEKGPSYHYQRIEKTCLLKSLRNSVFSVDGLISTISSLVNLNSISTRGNKGKCQKLKTDEMWKNSTFS